MRKAPASTLLRPFVAPNEPPATCCALTLILALLAGPGFVRIAAAAAPQFQGTFTSPGLCSPRGIDVSPAGDVFVGGDCGFPLHHVERFTAAGIPVGTWGFPFAYEGSPNGIALDGSGNVFVTDYSANRMYKFSSSGALLTRWGTTTAPVDVAVNASGDVFVAGFIGQRVQRFTNGGFLLATIGTAGSGPGQFQEPYGIAVDASGRIYVADPGRVRVLRFLANGTFDMEFTPPSAPEDVAVGPDGNVYVLCGFYAATVYQYSPDGTLLLGFTSPAPHGMYGAFRIAISPTGAIYVTEQFPGENQGRVTRFQIGPPDCSAAQALVPLLWPPNGSFQRVTITGVTDPDGDPVTLAVTGVTQDEPLLGNRCPDAQLDADGTVSVRAERNMGPHANGRVYRVAFTATDSHGATCDGQVRVCVPTTLNRECIEDTIVVNSFGQCSGAHAASLEAAPGFGKIEQAGDRIAIEYRLPQAGEVALTVFDVAGRRLATIDSGSREAGLHTARWWSQGIAPGVYFIRLRTGGESWTKTLALR